MAAFKNITTDSESAKKLFDAAMDARNSASNLLDLTFALRMEDKIDHDTYQEIFDMWNTFRKQASAFTNAILPIANQ